MSGDEITSVFDRLKADDEGAWLDLHAHIGIMISSWARKEKIEMDWVASEEGIGDSRSILKTIYSQFREQLLSGLLEVKSFADYKEAVLRHVQEILTDQFARFYSYLVDKNNNAWKRVNERVYMYAAKWLSEKKIDPETAGDIYQESAMTFFEKVTGSQLFFDTSRELKSYYFRILELKTMESNRRAVVHGQRISESDLGHLYRPIAEEGFEGDDKYFYIERIMSNTISKEELHILKHYYFNGDKLTTIAKSLQISDGNCRQKKLQALKKIEKVYRETASMKQNHRPN